MRKFWLVLIVFIFATVATAFAYQNPRWSYFPLSVYIQDHEKAPIVKRAFSTWESSTDGIAKFRFVSSEKYYPNIVVKFSENNPNTKGSQFENAVGLAHSYTPLGYYAKATITVWLKNPGNTSKLSDTQLYSISLHEIGHALGILRHSPLPQDIMYFQEHGQTSLSENDILRFKKIYTP